ncbi:MAG: hypothetical protein H7A34_03530 [bacterium]|nr:hypothetical protein [bacterium]
MNRRIVLIILYILLNVQASFAALTNGSISGKVTVAGYNEGVAGFAIEAVTGSEAVLISAITNADGSYTLSGITASQVYVRVPAQSGYEKRFYNGASTVALATAISQSSASIDIQLEESIAQPDSDSDGIKDAEEVILGLDGFRTNPADNDSDNDFLSDSEEVTLGADGFFTDPNRADTDNDGFSDNADAIPVPAYVFLSVADGVLANESAAVSAEVRDLYHNLIVKDGIQFTLHCTGAAVFAMSANTGILISGGGTQSVVMQTIGGVASIDVSSAVIENVDISATDNSGLNLMVFSRTAPFQTAQFPISEMMGDIHDTGIQFIDFFSQGIPIGFTFYHFGIPHSTINIHSNGFLTFETYQGIPTEPFFAELYTNDPIPNVSIPNDFIAPYWDDLDIESHGTGSIKYVNRITAAGEVFRVRWKDHAIYDSREAVNSLLTFNVQLYKASGLIEFSYETLQNGTSRMANGSSATIGAENSSGSGGLVFSYNTASVTEGLTILFSTHFPIAYFLSASGDFDNDGLTNQEERTQSFTSPLSPDTDGDTLPDKWEYDYGLNPNSNAGENGADGDFDNDGLSNIEELSLQTIPNDNDSDNDGLADGDEVYEYMTSPLLTDTDNDTLADGEEITFGADGFRTDPLLVDSDEDGVSDAVDTIPVFARLIIKEPSDVLVGNPEPDAVRFQLWSMEGDLLEPVNDFIFTAQVSGSAFFVPNPLKGTLLSGAGTNTVSIQLENGEAHVRVRDFTAEKVFFTAADPFSSGVRMPMQSAGFDVIPNNFIDIAQLPNRLALVGDDAAVNITLPSGFFLRFFDSLYSSAIPMKASTNGYVTFGSFGSALSNKPIPFHGSNDPDAFIAPFWDDLIVSAGSVYAVSIGSAPSRRFIIQWNNVALAVSPSVSLTFQIIFYEQDSLIEFHYGAMGNLGTSATIGIENETGTAGVSIGYNTSVLASFTGYALFDGDVPAMSFINGDYDGDQLSDIDELDNYGTDPAVRDSDNDGLGDGEEVLTHLTDPTNSDPDNDGLTDMQEIFDYSSDPFDANSDDDPFSDGEEALAGTDLNDPASYLHIIELYEDADTGDVVIIWSSVNGKKYDIYYSPDLNPGNFQLMGTNVQSSSDESLFVDQGDVLNNIPHPHSVPARMYRISVSQ